MQVLWAFGSLIGHSDMHRGMLSFKAEKLGAHRDEAAFDTAPAYCMTPMSFAPTSSARLPSGRLPHAIHPISQHIDVSRANWHKALGARHGFASLHWLRAKVSIQSFKCAFKHCARTFKRPANTSRGCPDAPHLLIWAGWTRPSRTHPPPWPLVGPHGWPKPPGIGLGARRLQQTPGSHW